MEKKDLYNRLNACLRFMDSRCDGAFEEDGMGFNGTDTNFGKSLAKSGIFTLKQAKCAHKMLIKYKNQLAGGGLEVPLVSDWSVYEKEEEVRKIEIRKEVELKPFDFNTLTWTPDKFVETRNGPHYVKNTFLPTYCPDFWNLWNIKKDELKSQGYTIFKEGNLWKLTKWTKVEVKPEVEKVSEYKIKNPKGLLNYQIPAVERNALALLNYGVTVDASGTGTGKTYISLGVARDLGLKPAVVCVKPTLKQWEIACSDMGIKPLFIMNWESVKNGHSGYGEFHPARENGPDGKPTNKFIWNLPENTLLIIDEIHRAKGQDTDNSKLVIAAKEQGIMTMGMSATIADNPLQMKATGFLLGLHNMVNFKKWCGRNGCESNGYGFVFNKFKDENKEHLKNIHNSIFPKKGNRIRVEDLGTDFPETLITADAISFNGETDKINKVYEELEGKIKKLRAQEKSSMEVITQILRARQKVELLKTKVLVELAEDMIEEGNSVAIFVNFDETIEVLSEKLGTDCIISGNPKWVKNRQNNIDAFQSDKSRIIIANIKAGGVGISLHDLNGNFPRVSLISPTYSAQDLKQVLGRVQRAGGKSKSIQKIIFAAGTVEDEARISVTAKLANIDTLNDGDIDLGTKIIETAEVK
jgi:superfamily II DNA or RNA helicase